MARVNPQSARVTVRDTGSCGRVQGLGFTVGN